MNSALSNKEDKISDSGWKSSSSLYYRKVGKLVLVTASGFNVSVGWTSLGTLPVGYRPSSPNGGSIQLAGSCDTYGSVHINISINPSSGSVSAGSAAAHSAGCFTTMFFAS